MMSIRFASRIPITMSPGSFTFKDPAAARQTLKADFPAMDFETDPPKITRAHVGFPPALANTDAVSFRIQAETDRTPEHKHEIVAYGYKGELYTKQDLFKADLVGITKIDEYDWTDYPLPE